MIQTAISGVPYITNYHIIILFAEDLLPLLSNWTKPCLDIEDVHARMICSIVIAVIMKTKEARLTDYPCSVIICLIFITTCRDHDYLFS